MRQTNFHFSRNGAEGRIGYESGRGWVLVGEFTGDAMSGNSRDLTEAQCDSLVSQIRALAAAGKATISHDTYTTAADLKAAVLADLDDEAKRLYPDSAADQLLHTFGTPTETEKRLGI